jgi:hypothetical protein
MGKGGFCDAGGWTRLHELTSRAVRMKSTYRWQRAAVPGLLCSNMAAYLIFDVYLFILHSPGIILKLFPEECQLR